jgi:hypothetical protein
LYKKNILDEEKIKKLEAVGFVWEAFKKNNKLKYFFLILNKNLI